MICRRLFSLVVAVLCIISVAAQAQQPSKVYLIGILATGSPATHGRRVEAFRQGLRDIGLIEGKNLVVEIRYAGGKIERFAELAAEMVRLKPDVIYVGGTLFTRAVQKATNTIPIVATAGDLVGDGVVSSLASPGGNVTGSTTISPDTAGKRLGLLKEAVPKISRVGVVFLPSTSGNDSTEVTETEITARVLRISVYRFPVRTTDELAGAFAAMKSKRADALTVIQGTFNNSHIKEIADLAVKNRLPTVGEAPDYANNGLLMSYGPNLDDLWRRGAIFVDKILKGRKPADLPVEQPMKFDFVINLQTAKEIRVTIPQSVLFRADKVIKESKVGFVSKD
jgi:putative ABC transport system substrate-binding protein